MEVNLPQNFMYNKMGFRFIGKAPLDIGRNLDPSTSVDLEDLMPFAVPICFQLEQLAAKKREELLLTLDRILEVGGVYF